MNRLITLLIFNLAFSQVFNTNQGTEYSTIGEALQYVNSGDIIQVSPGTYVESISIETSVNIEGSPGSIIDASNESYGLNLHPPIAGPLEESCKAIKDFKPILLSS